MKCLIFSDIHGDLRRLAELMDIEADYYFAAGDTVTWERNYDAAGGILKRRADRVYVLPGNHESVRNIEALCGKFGLHPFHERSIGIRGFHVAGFGYSNPTPFNTPGEYAEKEITARLERFASLDPLILICHCPPKGTPLDEMRPGAHAGSTAIAEFITRRQPRYFFCGHIHEAEGVEARLGSTIARNAGKKGHLLDFDKIEI